MRLTHTPAVQDYRIAGLELGMGGRDHLAGEIDARDHRPTSDDRRLGGDRQAILVVDGGVADAHEDIALHQVALAQLLPRKALAGFIFGSHQCLETLHPRTPGHLGWIAFWLGHLGHAVEKRCGHFLAVLHGVQLAETTVDSPKFLERFPGVLDLQQRWPASGIDRSKAILQAPQWGCCGRIVAFLRTPGLIIHEYMNSSKCILLYKTKYAVVIVHHGVRQLGNSQFNHRIIALQHRNLLVNRNPPS